MPLDFLREDVLHPHPFGLLWWKSLRTSPQRYQVLATPCVLPPQCGEYEEWAELAHARLQLDIRKNFLTMRVVRGLKEITVSGSFGLNVHREERLRTRKHLPPLVVLGPQLLPEPSTFQNQNS